MPEAGPSSIQLDELFAAEDARFLEVFRAFTAPRKLESIVARWLGTPGPWPRDQIRRYFDEPMNVVGHELVVKRLFKHVEDQKDHEAVAWCMVAFDRLVRRQRRFRYRFDRETRQGWQEEHLYTPINRVYPSGHPYGAYYRNREGDRLFNYPTRHHLRRRAWRYFRRLGFMTPERYVPGIAHSLTLYVDDDFARGENVIDNWAMMHACYFKHPAITFRGAYCRLEEGASLGDLTPAPYHLHLWQETEAFDVLMNLLGNARSSLIRLWALEMIQSHHAALVKSLTIAQLMPLLDHSDTRVQGFAAEAFTELDGLGHLPIETWLSLLEGTNVQTLSLICMAMEKHVAPERLSDAQLLIIAQARAVPVAQMGLDLIRARHSSRPLDLGLLVELAEMNCRALASDGAQWFLDLLTTSLYDDDLAIRFFDSPHREVRETASAWLTPDCPGWHDPSLWTKLIETPFDDLRLTIVAKLEQRSRLPGREPETLAPLWISVILGVSRGNRHKPQAIRQILQAIVQQPERAEALVPVLGLAVRSIRGPERRAGLAAVAALVEAAPETRPVVNQAIPELGLAPVLEPAG